MAKHDWMVQIPVNDIIGLMGLEDQLQTVLAENKQLRRELEGLRAIQSQTIELVGDLRRQCAAR